MNVREIALNGTAIVKKGDVTEKEEKGKKRKEAENLVTVVRREKGLKGKKRRKKRRIKNERRRGKGKETGRKRGRRRKKKRKKRRRKKRKTRIRTKTKIETKKTMTQAEKREKMWMRTTRVR